MVGLDPTKGKEMKKRRPAVVVSSNAVGTTGLRIIVPLTGWDEAYSSAPWFVRFRPTTRNGLKKESAADCFQVRSVSVSRFVKRTGAIAAGELKRVVEGILLCIDYVPNP